ncbi:hypothetical protein IQ268_08475 [Oculatella sp. LEGE 06141]|uniref:hypothetical protein n=1 Tax=Oculatella sp. LEGE 06141 TaxID=1828648 RepID=UPI001882C91D|nr:hypothetical protein [Oculatella sp. LEGE 06141]MBE9178592.1 hypothetical protein [Oculatella sp. LEGE 06141]
MSLILQIANLSVSLDVFASKEYPRIRADIGKVSYTAAGTPVGSGTFYEPKHLWDINVLLEDRELHLLKLIYAEHDFRRRSLQDANVTIIDTTQYYEERLPRTRAIAPGTEQLDLPEPNPTHCLYYAQFKAWFSQEPRFDHQRAYWGARFTLVETDKVAAV